MVAGGSGLRVRGFRLGDQRLFGELGFTGSGLRAEPFIALFGV